MTAILVVDESTRSEASTANLLQTALTVQMEFGRRIQDAKSKLTADEMEQEITAVCQDVLKYISDWVSIGKRAVFGEGCMLSWADEYWNELGPLHSQYESFDEMAHELTSEEYSTYRAKIAVFRCFIENRYKVAKIAEIGMYAFLDVPLGKMQKAVAKARKDEMDEGQWEALLDPHVNDAQFRAIMAMTPEQRASSDQRFVESGTREFGVTTVGELVYWRKIEDSDDTVQAAASVTIGRVYIDSDNPAVLEAVDVFLKKVGIKRL